MSIIEEDNQYDMLNLKNNQDDDPYRTAFHFQPPNNWMNDPNAPMIYKGIYHLFYQYYPHEADWHTEIVWGHSTSTDLINWKPQPIALSPSEPYDINGCWSGSVTILPNEHKLAILYTSIDHQKNQVQNLAFPKDSSDPYLKQWVKAPQNPVMFGTPANLNNINASEFRDPTTAWKLKSDGKWRVIVGTQQEKRGIAVVFTSDDFLNWSYVDQPFHSAEGTGIWECPDFFPVYVGKSVGADTSVVGDEVKHVLKVSLFDTHFEYYTIGGYDTVKDVYVPDEGSVENDSGLRLDYGRFYASKSFFDELNNRRILWGWVSEGTTTQDNIKRGWAGLQAIPRTIVLDKSGKQLVHWPLAEFETLRGNQVELPSQIIGERSPLIQIPGVTAAQADVEISFRIPELKHAEELDPTWTDPQRLCLNKGASVKGSIGPFGLLTLASAGLVEYNAVFFRIFKSTNNKYMVLMCDDPTRSSLNPTTEKPSYGTFVDVDPLTEELSLRILIDHSIVESFGANGKNCITARVYPTLAIHDKAKLYAFNYGSEDVEITKLTAWSMNKAQINNLTYPNGPVIYKGIYHLFYQYYPHDVAWHTEIVWGHSTSTDLINWKPQPIALSPSEPYDINGCWSGSVTILPNEHKPAILYTSIDHQKNQVQNLAFPKDSSDPYLKQWVKAPQNPVMFGTPANSNNINASEFRDPTTAWKLKSDGKWRVIVGTQQGKRGIVVVFTSDDFLNWSYVDQPFHSAEGTGIWECPDFFPVYVGKSVGADTSVVGDEVKHVLKVSLFDTQYEYYTIGEYDTVNDVYVPDDGSIESDLGLRLDYGKFYASKSFFDDKINRRVLWGWVNESSTSVDDIKKGWSGIQAIPRTIVLDKSGKQLVHWPVTEVETLRENPVELLPQVIRGGSLVEISGVTASQADVEISFKIPESNHVEKLDPTWTNPQILCSEKGTSNKGRVGPFGLLTLASEGLEEYTAVFFRIFKAQNNHVVLMCSDQSRSSLNPTTDKLSFGTFVDVDPLSEELSLRILIDHSIVESFGANGKNCITARVYPTLAIHEKAKLYAFNYGSEDVVITKFIAWSMKRAQINNLTSQKGSNNHKSKVGNEEL